MISIHMPLPYISYTIYDGHLYVADAVKRGAVAVAASREIDMDGILGCKALILVKNTNSLLPVLAASEYVCFGFGSWKQII